MDIVSEQERGKGSCGCLSMGKDIRLGVYHVRVRDKIEKVVVVRSRDKTEESVARAGDRGGAGVVRAVFLRPLHCKKKVIGFPLPSRDVSNQTLPGRE